MKERANNSGEKTRTILSQGMVNYSESSIASLPRLESVKRTIRRHKSVDQDSTINQASAADVHGNSEG